MEIDLTGLVLPSRVEVTGWSEDGRRADFVLQPLERGYGHTLGNSLRRVLLSSLPGAALWAFRADGVVHEHQTIPSVVEDVHQIIQNLKTLVLRLADDVPEVKLELSVARRGVVTARQIQPHAAATIVNPDHVLFTLAEDLPEDRPFRMELWAKKGRGFVLADQHPRKPKEQPVDLLFLDSIFNPVTRVNFVVEETRVGQRTDFDRLTLTVETNGAIAPKDAVAYAAELLVRHLDYFRTVDAAPAPERVRRTRWVLVDDRIRDVINRPLEDFDLSVRSRNTLEKGNIRTLGDVVRMTEEEMLRVENFGRKSLEEVAELLRQHGLRFGMKFQEGEDGHLYLLEESGEGEGPPAEDAGVGPLGGAAGGAGPGEGA
jgi:DNA-directed RNA polymerase subunit alpha